MVCLLPLRGWAGQLMAVEMAMQQVTQVVVSASDRVGRVTPGSMPVMPDDCPMHTGASGAPANGPTDTSSLSCSGCDTCELCLAIASCAAPYFQATPFSPSAAPAAMPHGFVSADRASRLKPPIS